MARRDTLAGAGKAAMYAPDNTFFDPYQNYMYPAPASWEQPGGGYYGNTGGNFTKQGGVSVAKGRNITGNRVGLAGGYGGGGYQGMTSTGPITNSYQFVPAGGQPSDLRTAAQITAAQQEAAWGGGVAGGGGYAFPALTTYNNGTGGAGNLTPLQQMIERNRQDKLYQDQLNRADNLERERQKMIADWQKAQDEAKQANESRYMDILQGYGNEQQAIGDRMANLDQRYNSGMAGISTLYGSIAGGQDERYKALLASAQDALKGSGEQESKNIQQSWQNQGSKAQGDLVSRGLSGTSILASENRANQTGMQNDLGALQERIRQQNLGLITGIGGNQISANERILGQGAGAVNNLTSSQLAALERAGGSLSNNAYQRLGVMENRTDSYPDSAPLMSALQGMGASSPYRQDGGYAAGLGYGVNSAGAFGGAANQPLASQYNNGYGSAFGYPNYTGAGVAASPVIPAKGGLRAAPVNQMTTTSSMAGGGMFKPRTNIVPLKQGSPIIPPGTLSNVPITGGFMGGQQRQPNGTYRLPQTARRYY